MNANDHVPMVHILPFGLCKKGMPCMPLTPLAWVDVNKKHIIEGAPALTEDSKLACFHGGVITIVPLDAGSAEEGDRNENAEDSVESIAAEALAFAGSLAGKGKGIKNLVKKSRSSDEIKRPYSNIPDSPTVGPGKKFTKAQKEKLIQENLKRNGGVVRSDQSGIELTRPKKSQRGVKPDPNEWQIDHIDSRSRGGSNSNSNAQVLSRQENRTKSDK